jgi:hypothetical protein
LPAVEIFHISLDPGDIMDAAHCAVVGNSAWKWNTNIAILSDVLLVKADAR